MKPHLISNYFSSQDKEDLLYGSHHTLYEKCGVKVMKCNGVYGGYFCVWAPHAKRVAVIGSFNDWDGAVHCLQKSSPDAVVFEGFVPGVKKGDLYKFRITAQDGTVADKIDPFARFFEVPPKSASIVYQSDFQWSDGAWLTSRKDNDYAAMPMSVYELHLGSWKKKDKDRYDSFYSYRELAKDLVRYVKRMGFSHIELMPVVEHPYYPSWGYHGLGYFAPSARYGAPDDFKFFIDECHRQEIGVILDWVPSHFPMDQHGLIKFDGTNLFESEEVHPDWGSCIFDLGKNSVVSFLISNAFFWCKEFHIDGIRVDAVASMLYLDYSRSPEQWQPNMLGGKENFEAIAFLRRLNIELKESLPDVLLIAEESSAWPMVSARAKSGGLNFDMKWNMGWMHDVLEYFSFPEKKRKIHSEKLAWSFSYMQSEKFILSLSHDEVVHGKSSLLGKMPGNDKEKFDHLRCLLGFMYMHPGKKLLFMGMELAPWNEWNHDQALEWPLLAYSPHAGIQQWIRDLNALYKKEAALHEIDFDDKGFEFITHDVEAGVLIFLRKSRDAKECLLFIGNFYSNIQKDYKITLPYKCKWVNILNSNSIKYSDCNTEKQFLHFIADSSPEEGCCYQTTIPSRTISIFKCEIL